MADLSLLPAHVRDLPRAAEWLSLQVALGRTSNTVAAYGRGLDDYLSFCSRTGIDPERAGRAEISTYVRDIAERPPARGGSAIRRPPRRRSAPRRRRRGREGASRPRWPPPTSSPPTCPSDGRSPPPAARCCYRRPPATVRRRSASGAGRRSCVRSLYAPACRN